MFDLIVNKEPLIQGMKTLEDIVSAFLHLCFVANLQYPAVNFWGFFTAER